MKQYVSKGAPKIRSRRWHLRHTRYSPPFTLQLAWVIHVIFGGPTAGGISNAQRKKYARSVYVVVLLRKKTKTTEAFFFSDADMKRVQVPYDDVVMITVKIGDSTVQKILVDTDSLCDVLFLSAFQQIDIDMKKFGATPRLMGFIDYKA